MSEPIVATCPFCGETEIETQVGATEQEGLPVNAICTSCRATGPVAFVSPKAELLEIRVKAYSAWNKRS